jgi:hypothetical protein
MSDKIKELNDSLTVEFATTGCHPLADNFEDETDETGDAEK